jgi:lysophospholipase L1-like esterase
VRRRGTSRDQRALAVVFSIVLGAVLGAALALRNGAAFVVPDPVDRSRWNVIVPGLDEAVLTPELGRGTQVVGGALVLVPHVFDRADILTPRDGRAVGAVSLTLAPDSGPVHVHLRHDAQFTDLALTPSAWSDAPGRWTPHSGPYDLRITGARLSVDGVEVAGVRSPTVEILADAEEVRITSLQLSDETGAAFLTEDPGAAWRGRAPVAAGALLGALVALALAVAGTSVPGAILLLALPVAVTFLPHRAWLALLERLYLVRLPAWDLARIGLAAALLPVLVQALAGTRSAVPESRSDPRAVRIWAAAALLAALPASRDLSGTGWLLLPVGIAFLLAPLALLRSAELDPRGLLLRDLPSFAAPAIFGWGPGLLAGLAWRLVLLVAGAGTLLRKAPRAGADALFLCALALIPAAELAARSTWLDTAWDTDRLAGGDDWQHPSPWWEGRCGEDPRPAVLFAGGSSTGGAYQFVGEPEAFFPARTHAQLCAAGESVRTTNYGHGGRDSFTISRSIDFILAEEHPAVVVLYLGVNDLLTEGSTLTRKQRETAEAERGRAFAGLAALAAHSRLLNGVELLLRRATPDSVPRVPDVPLADAEENLRCVAAATDAAGIRLLLLTEYTDATTAARLSGYQAMEARLAAELPGVSWLDVSAALAPFGAEGLLVDRNHLSRQGSERLGEALTPPLQALLHPAE